MMRGEETIEKERERNGQRARSGKIAGYIARCSVRDAGCRWKKMRAIVTMAVDTSPPSLFLSCLPFTDSAPVFSPLDL